MAKPSDHPDFAAMLAEWNGKLKESGLVDIEQGLPSGTVNRFQRLSPLVRQAQLDFFRLVGQHVAETQFQDQREEQILLLYSQGHSQASIKAFLGIKGNRCHVYEPIYRWLKAWGLKPK